MASLGSASRPNVARQIRDVWAWNFNAELDEFLATIANEPCAVIALDTEFPGFLCADSVNAMLEVRYMSLQHNVDLLQPIQLGLAAAGTNGVLRGAWNFNLWFDLANSLYNEESVRFLSAAGIDFPRHAIEGIDPRVLAWRFLDCQLVGCHCKSPRWVTFSGWYDWGYLMKVLTGCAMPVTLCEFERVVASFCPHRCELRDNLPRGSLDNLMAAYGIQRVGYAHTAGSDALATLELFLRVELLARTAVCKAPGKSANSGNKGIEAIPAHSAAKDPQRCAAITVAQHVASQLGSEVTDATNGDQVDCCIATTEKVSSGKTAANVEEHNLNLPSVLSAASKSDPDVNKLRLKTSKLWPTLQPFRGPSVAPFIQPRCLSRCLPSCSALIARLSEVRSSKEISMSTPIIEPRAHISCPSSAMCLLPHSGLVGKFSAMINVDGQWAAFSLQAFFTICVFVFSCCYVQL